MAAKLATTSFLNSLRASGLLAAAQLAELSRCPEARDPSPTPLARVVFRRGWLTRFQLNAVAAGRAGDLTVGPYLLLERLGEGGMGTVYKARHQHMQRAVALKVIRKDRLASPKAVKRFYQEIKLAGALHHPNIVLAYDAGPAGRNHYFAMEYVEGVDLARLVKENGPLPVPQACDYVRQAALGLQHAHEKGLVHRDIKPSNLLVSRAPADTGASAASEAAPRGDVVKLLDLGLARLQGDGDTGMTRTGTVVGTPDYLAPEQALNAKAADIRADLYSLGCTLYCLLTGKPPFRCDEVAEVLLKHQLEKPLPLAERGVEAPEEVQAILDRLLAKHPEERFQTPSELADALAPFCREGTLAANVFETLRDAGRPEHNEWASLTLGDDREKGGSGRSQACGRTVESSRHGPRTAGKGSRAGDEAGGVKKRQLLLAGVGGGAGLLLGLLAAVLWWRSGPAPEGRLAQAPLATQPARNGPEGAPEGGKPTPPGGENTAPLQKSDGTVPPPNGDGNPVVPPGPPPADVPVAAGTGAVILPANKGVALALAFSPDGKRAVVGGFQVRLWDVEHNKELHDFGGTKFNGVRCLTWSADGRRVLAGVGRGQVLLLDAEKGTVPVTFAGHATEVHAVALSPDGRHALSGAGAPVLKDNSLVKGPDGKLVYEDTDVRLWEVATGREVGRYRGPSGPLAAVAFSADGKHVFAVPHPAADGSCYDWEMGKPEAPRMVPVPPAQLSWAISPDAREVALLGGDCVLRVYDLETGKELRHSDTLADVSGLSWSRDGRYLACGGVTRHEQNAMKVSPIRLLDAATCNEVRRLVGHANGPIALDVSPGGRYVLASTLNDGVRLWDLGAAAAPGKPVAVVPTPDKLAPVPDKSPFAGHNGSVLAVAFSADGKKLLSAGKDQTVRLWDVATGQEVKKLSGLLTAPSRVGFAGGDRRAVATSLGSGFQCWDIETGKALRQEGFGQHRADALAADGEQVLMPRANNWVEVAKTRESGGGTRPITGKWETVVAATFAPDGHSVLFVGGDGLLHFIDLRTEKELGKGFPGLKGDVICLAVSPKATHILTATEDKTVTLWKLPVAPVTALQAVHTFKGHKDKVTCLAFALDGRHVVTGGDDATVRVWDAQGKEVAQSAEHKEAVRAVSFSPDGKAVVSCGDGIRLWEWQPKPPAKP
jgi:serine/threonine-protein kinase